MLWFLSLTAERGFVVESYTDEAVGTMARIAPGRQAITEVVLRPRIAFVDGKGANADEVAALHEAAHERCFIANSVKCAIRIETPA